MCHEGLTKKTEFWNDAFLSGWLQGIAEHGTQCEHERMAIMTAAERLMGCQSK